MPYYGFKSEVLARLDKIIANQEAAAKQGMKIMATMDEVVAKVEEEKTMVDGLKTFVQGLRDQITALPNMTPQMQAQIDQVFTTVSANSQGIADAMAANTPPHA
jgi:uncharacterized coiled-coil protein SlyX